MGAIISAVKLLPTPIHTENEDDKNFRDFQNEVEKLKKVNEDPNPNVVKIINSGLTESGSFPFIEMEYIEGPDLAELLQAPNPAIFTIRETIKLATQLSNALAHCHRARVKHGDIKSNNVKFNTETGNYVLLDFGLAVMSDEQRRSSLRHAGAVEFMAPEQHEGELLFQSDVYSFGIIVYELLAGAVPFPLISKSETNRNQVMISHIEKSVPDLMILRKNKLPADWAEEKRIAEMNVPAWLQDIVARCLEKSPTDRFANGVELHDAICNQIERPPVLVEHVSSNDTKSELELLKSENERLHAELNGYKRYFKSKMLFFVAALVIVSVLSIVVSSMMGSESTGKSTHADSTNLVKKDSPSIQRKPGNTVKKQPPERKKVIPAKTKDGLINDVPEF